MLNSEVCPIRIGTAGWSLPSAVRERFLAGDSLLARYARALNAVEINSAFYRPHQRKTYQRWAASTPPGFRFAVKAPREVTHDRRLIDVAAPLERFLDEIAGLGDRLGPVLFQLPPSLAFTLPMAEAFFNLWRGLYDGETVIEPRHATWFTPSADSLLIDHRIARVAADPAVVPAAAGPGGWLGFQYHRLHGSPQIYASAYDAAVIERISQDLPASAWVIFDNTKFGAATENALHLRTLTRPTPDLVSETPDAR